MDWAVGGPGGVAGGPARTPAATREFRLHGQLTERFLLPLQTKADV